MKLNKILTKINPNDFIKDYLEEKGVENCQHYIQKHLSFEPYEYYLHMKEGEELFNSSIEKNKEAILIVDCDCDGIISSAISLAYLQLVGVTTHLFSHKVKLHGLDDKCLVDKIKQSNCELIIIPDASGKEEDITDLINCGKKILCLDHHPTELQTTKNFVCINNKQNIKGNKELSGAGVAWKFFWQYCYQKNFQQSDKLPFMDLVGLSVISDSCSVIPLESKYFLNQVLKNVTNPFLCYLIKELIGKDYYNGIDLSFKVIPKINASVRSGNVELQERMVKAFANIKNKQSNDNFELLKADMISAHKTQTKEVKKITENLLEQAEKDINNVVTLLYENEDSYTGLIANKIMSNINKPVFIVHEDKENNNIFMGSARSPINNFKSICNNSKLFNWNKGHECAFGVNFNKQQLNEINKYFNNLQLENTIDVCDIIEDGMIPIYYFDMLENKSLYQLWCNDLPEPIFAVNLHKVNGTDWASYRGNTIKLFYNNISYIKFMCSNKIKQKLHIGEDFQYDLTIIGALQYNHYNGKSYPQMIIKDFEIKDCSNSSISFNDLW